MIFIGQMVDWKGQRFTCVESKELAGKRAVIVYKWQTQCECGADYSFTCAPWRFPFCAPAVIAKSGIVKPMCYACAKSGKKKLVVKLSDTLSESLWYVLREVLHSPMTVREIEAAICKMPHSTYMACFKPDEVELAKQAMVAIKRSYAKGGNGIIGQVMTKMRKQGSHVYRGNRWYRGSDQSDSVIVRRQPEILQAAAGIVAYLLTAQPKSTNVELSAAVATLKLRDDIRAKFALDGSARAQAAALMRILLHMRDTLQIVKADRQGRGARWELLP